MLLSSILDTVIVETNGFRIFSDTQTIEMIKILAKKCGIVIMTDSDFAGFKIRNFIKNKIQEGNIFDAYLPQIEGKEKRKSQPSKEGFLGVEGFKEQDILSSLSIAGITEFKKDVLPSEKITRFDLYSLGLNGHKNSREKREVILKKLSLPTHLSSTVLPDVISAVISKDEFIALVNETFKN